MIEPHNNNREYRTRGKFGGEDNAFKFVLVQFEIPIKHVRHVHEIVGDISRLRNTDLQDIRIKVVGEAIAVGETGQAVDLRKKQRQKPWGTILSPSSECLQHLSIVQVELVTCCDKHLAQCLLSTKSITLGMRVQKGIKEGPFIQGDYDLIVEGIIPN